MGYVAADKASLHKGKTVIGYCMTLPNTVMHGNASILLSER